MLDPLTTTLLADRVVVFVNEPVSDARQIELMFWESPVHGLPPSPEMAALFARDAVKPSRRASSGELDPWALPLARHPLAHYERLRRDVLAVLRTKPRRPAVERFLEEMTRAHPDYVWTTIHGILCLDRAGRLMMDSPRLKSVTDVVAVVLAELESPEAPAVILECGFSECDKFFLRMRGTGSRGQPRKFCSDRCKKLHHTREKNK